MLIAVACPFMTVKDVRGIRGSVSTACQWRALSRSYLYDFFNMLDKDMLFVRHSTEILFVRRIREMLRTNISFESDWVYMFCCSCFLRSVRIIGDRRWKLGVEIGPWKFNIGGKVCPMVATISSCQCLQQELSHTVCYLNNFAFWMLRQASIAAF